MSDAQQQVQQVLDELVETGTERGLQVAAYHDGELVIDAVAGTTDAEAQQPVRSDTLFTVTSVGKAVASTLVHILVERGELSYDTRIAELWPEFGAHGKENATVRQALTHTVGLPGIPVDTTTQDLGDWDKMCAAIADSEPWWTPGEKIGYHALTFGWIVGEIIQRVTGKPLAQVLREEISEPLGIADELFFGVPESELDRVSLQQDAPAAPGGFGEMPPDHPILRIGPLTMLPHAGLYNPREVLTADIPASGNVTARAVAKVYAALVTGVDGVRLLSPERLREVTAVAERGEDQIFGGPFSTALGYFRGRPGPEPVNGSGLFGYSGVSGAHAEGDLETGISFAIAKNLFTTGDHRTAARVAEIATKAILAS